MKKILALLVVLAATAVALPAAQAQYAPPARACSDGIDNDSDGLIDYPADPGCANSKDRDEFNAPPPPPPPPAACADGIDNDGDSLIDFPADPGCTSTSDTDETNAPPPPPGDWVHIADEWELFTLSEQTNVRFGKDASWNVRLLDPGTYECSYFTFPPDPAPGIFKECQAQSDDPPPPPPADAFFVSDFEEGNLSEWQDFHDAHLNESPPGVQIVSNPLGGLMAKINTTSNYPTTGNGDATMLWMGDGGNAYSLPFMQNGQSTWFRWDFRVPSASFQLATGWNTIQSFHTDPGAVSAYSTATMLHNHGGTPQLLFRPVGGDGEGTFTYRYQTNSTTKSGDPNTGGCECDRIAFQYDVTYTMVVHMVFGPDSSSGSFDWWVNGIQQMGGNVPTIARASGGSVPGLGAEWGLYRSPASPTVSNIFFDNIRVGPTQASVSG
jgi:hypothetical protein